MTSIAHLIVVVCWVVTSRAPTVRSYCGLYGTRSGIKFQSLESRHHLVVAGSMLILNVSRERKKELICNGR